MAIYPYSFTLPPVNKQDIPSNGVPGEFLGISAGGVLDWLPVSGGSGTGDLLAANNLSELTNFATARTNIGLGTTSTPTFANLTLTSPSLSSSAPVTISQTWNAVGQTFKAFVVNAAGTSDANSASGSLLLDLQLGGVSKIRAGKIGDFWAGSPFGGYQLTNGSTRVSGWGANQGGSLGGLGLASSFVLGWSSGTDGGNFGLLDTILLRDSDSGNTLALRNGAAAQTFNVYGTYTSGTVYERMFMRYTAASTLAFQIGTEQVGATARPLQFSISGSRRLIFEATGVNDTQIYAAGNTGRNILTLRSLDESGRYQFYINAAGKSELYVGTGALISEAGSSYFNGGNVGIGTTAPTSRLHVQATGQTGVRENLLKCTVSDSGNDAFYMANSTVADGSFVPGFIGAVFSSSARYCLNLAGQTTAANDTGTAPMVAFSAAITTDATDPNNGTLSAVGTRPLFTWVNFTTTHMQMAANGNLGIGTTSPTSKLQVSAGDVEVDTIAKGVILKSPDGTRYRVTVANGGTLSVAAV